MPTSLSQSQRFTDLQQLESDFFNTSIIQLPRFKDGGFGAAANTDELSRTTRSEIADGQTHHNRMRSQCTNSSKSSICSSQQQTLLPSRKPRSFKISSGIDVMPPGLRVISAMNLSEDVLKQCGIKRGMRVFDLTCGAGDAFFTIAKLVGPTGLVVVIDPSAEAIEAASRRATVAGQCYWTRFVTADLNTFVPPERFDAVVVRLNLFRAERDTLLRLSAYVRPYGVIVIASGKSGWARRSAGTSCTDF